MPETTDNDTPGADRPAARTGQEGPSPTGAPAQSPGGAEVERAAREAARRATEGAAEGEAPEPGTPTDMAP
jgi:hypothetical protein